MTFADARLILAAQQRHAAHDSPTAARSTAAFEELLDTFASEADLLPLAPPVTLRQHVSNLLREAMAGRRGQRSWHHSWAFTNCLLCLPANNPMAMRDDDDAVNEIYRNVYAHVAGNADLIAWLRTLDAVRPHGFFNTSAAAAGAGVTSATAYSQFLDAMVEARVDTESAEFDGAMHHLRIVARHGIVGWRARQFGVMCSDEHGRIATD